MTMLGGRGGRSDDWKTPHFRARARAAERLDGPLDPAEEAWLDDHLAECSACAGAAADYAGQAFELRALRDRAPLPPRDLWARTAAAIEREAGPNSRRRRSSLRSIVAPYALLASAIVVAVAVGSFSVSNANPSATAANTPAVAIGQTQPPIAMATPMPRSGSVRYITQNGGKLQLNYFEFSYVCAPSTTGCATTGPADTRTIGPVSSPDTVFGAAAGDGPLVVMSRGNGSGGKVFAIAIASQLPAVTPSPTPSASAGASVTASATTTPTPTPSPSPGRSAATSPPPPPSIAPSASATDTASPSGEPSPPPSAAAVIEIARDLKVLDTTAAYAPDGSAFAFTARPADGSHGPDIYVWHVGDPQAVPVTTDHRSVFGSWAGDAVVGSAVTTEADGRLAPLAFILPKGATELTPLPAAGRAWRPVVDPTGRAAVYWSGRLEATPDGLGWSTSKGRLVLGRWDDMTATASPSASASPDASTTTTASPSTTASPDATQRSDADQQRARSETKIAEGPLTDWDARWDETGTRLAVWIANPKDPSVGLLSLYDVDPFDGRIDLSKPPLADEPALAGFSIAHGHLAWAAPPEGGSSTSSVRVLAWTGNDFGQVESAPDDVILVR